MSTAYLIYDEEGEMFDVLNFNTPEELKTYQQLNPTYSVKMADSALDDSLFIESIEDEEFIDENDDVNTW